MPSSHNPINSRLHKDSLRKGNLSILPCSHPLRRAVRSARMVVVCSVDHSCKPPSATIATAPASSNPTARSSSPVLPSPSQLLSDIPLRPQGESRVSLFSSHAAAKFTSASNILRLERSVSEDASTTKSKTLDLEDGQKLQKGSHKHSKATIPRKEPMQRPTFRKPKLLHGEEANSSSKNTASDEITIHESRARVDVLAPKRTRKKKSRAGEETQRKIKKAKITKPGATKGVEKSKTGERIVRKTEEADSAASEPLTGTQVEDARARDEFRDLCLEKAIPRRKQWTPVRDTMRTSDHTDAVGGDLEPVSPSKTSNAQELSDTCFGKLVGDFEFPQREDCSKSILKVRQCQDGEAVVKRRKVELGNQVLGPPLEEAQRPKSPKKKKAQTVTAKATAPFVPAEDSTSPLLQYFGAPVVEPGNDSNGQNDNAERPIDSKPRVPVKKATKPRSTTRKVKKPVETSLLSPESALKTASNQKLVFGTSSQLAREESPAFLKEVQQAIQASEPMTDGWDTLAPAPPMFKPYNSLALARSKGLWSVAARNLEGALLNAELVDLSGTPKTCKVSLQSTRIPESSQILEIEQETPSNGERDIVVREATIAPMLNIVPSPVLLQEVREADISIPRSVAEAALKKRPRARSPIKKLTGGERSSDHMPNYKGFTDVQLSKEVSSYGFKSIKKREAMIVLLERCWESKVSIALQEVPANASIHQPTKGVSKILDEVAKERSPIEKKGRPLKATTTEVSEKTADAPPKKARGRPKKDSSIDITPGKRKRKASSPSRSNTATTATSLAADEIYDSSPPTPSPPRRRSPSKLLRQLPLTQPTTPSDDIGEAVSTKAAEARLLAEVTKAITTFPPSNDPLNLTFHEKILMYEPIVLEDLAIWLNAEGLGRVGEDEEVSPEQVKAWCEARSVCCLWRENLRGGARARW